MEEKKVRNTIEAYLKAYEKNDRAGLLALFAANARFTDPVGTPSMLGRGPDGSGLDLDVADHFVLNEDGTIREARAFWNPSCMTAVAAKRA